MLYANTYVPMLISSALIKTYCNPCLCLFDHGRNGRNKVQKKMKGLKKYIFLRESLTKKETNKKKAHNDVGWHFFFIVGQAMPTSGRGMFSAFSMETVSLWLEACKLNYCCCVRWPSCIQRKTHGTRPTKIKED